MQYDGEEDKCNSTALTGQYASEIPIAIITVSVNDGYIYDTHNG